LTSWPARATVHGDAASLADPGSTATRQRGFAGGAPDVAASPGRSSARWAQGCGSPTQRSPLGGVPSPRAWLHHRWRRRGRCHLPMEEKSVLPLMEEARASARQRWHSSPHAASLGSPNRSAAARRGSSGNSSAAASRGMTSLTRPTACSPSGGTATLSRVLVDYQAMAAGPSSA
jgi:hypothetical protein